MNDDLLRMLSKQTALTAVHYDGMCRQGEFSSDGVERGEISGGRKKISPENDDAFPPGAKVFR
jgi:hypothetical protein